LTLWKTVAIVVLVANLLAPIWLLMAVPLVLWQTAAMATRLVKTWLARVETLELWYSAAMPIRPAPLFSARMLLSANRIQTLQESIS